jgi:hypothetical protein
MSQFSLAAMVTHTCSQHEEAPAMMQSSSAANDPQLGGPSWGSCHSSLGYRNKELNMT